MDTARLVRDLQAQPDIERHQELLHRISRGFYDDDPLDAQEGAPLVPFIALGDALFAAGYHDIAHAVLDGLYDAYEMGDDDGEDEGEQSGHCGVPGCTEEDGFLVRDVQEPSRRVRLCTPHMLRYCIEGEFWTATPAQRLLTWCALLVSGALFVLRAIVLEEELGWTT